MKHIFIFSIRFYQQYLSIVLKMLIGTRQFCRSTPSCSAYAIDVIQRLGVLKGVKKAFLKILTCQPYIKYEHTRTII